jgi:hypothetical protein
LELRRARRVIRHALRGRPLVTLPHQLISDRAEVIEDVLHTLRLRNEQPFRIDEVD